MKLCNINIDGKLHLGISTARGIIDAAAAGFRNPMDELIAGGDLRELRELERDNTLPVVENPVFGNILNRAGKILCVGLNYKAHVEGIKMELPKSPALFSKFDNALTFCGAEIGLPDWEESYDYEAELVIAMGKKAWGVSENEAMDCVFGYTCGNDLSCREPQMRSGQWLIGKTMPGFGPCGPFIVTADEFDPDEGKNIRSYVNGELRQNGSTADMIFKCREIISYASKYIGLEPGDLIFTGTPSGAALEKDKSKRRWLKSGDKVDIVIEDIGRLTNYMK
jgi:2-keto-4-pentenoate hydratase/2-oxohepta-3-ene-1,7-dioic acid hydratase in catechol pathway